MLPGQAGRAVGTPVCSLCRGILCGEAETVTPARLQELLRVRAALGTVLC